MPFGEGWRVAERRPAFIQRLIVRPQLPARAAACGIESRTMADPAEFSSAAGEPSLGAGAFSAV